MNRREWLRLGGLAGTATLNLGSLRQSRASSREPADQAAGFGRAKSVILLVAGGGQSQIDTWDPKPDAPSEVRGEFSSIATRIPGARFCEHLPLTAQIADRLCVVRSMSHEDLDHGSAMYLTLTGRYHRKRSANPAPAADDLPCLGAALTRVRPTEDFVQTAVHINGPVLAPIEPAAGQYAGLLGPNYAPLSLDDVSTDRLAIPGLQPLSELSAVRLDERSQLRRQLDQRLLQLDQSRRLRDAETAYERAFDMLGRPESRLAFDLGRERPELREAYGRNRTGQSCLLARRLVEAGCPLVTVFLNHTVRGQDLAAEVEDEWGWDTHNDIFDGLSRWLLPRFDRAYSTLISDMASRGLLEETLVVCLGEFGRAPLVALEKRFTGASPGRKHWGAVYSIVFAGAGVRPGTIVGASDAQGGYPVTAAYGPWDTLATIFSALGVDPQSEYHDPAGRPYRLSDGRVIEPLYRG
ncbi:MAG: DUF1501 domain-containing protein [Planctomycetaceae bacterium]